MNDAQARRRALREFRSRRVLTSVIVAALIAIAAALVTIEVVSRLTGSSVHVLPVGALTRQGDRTQWDDPLSLAVSGITCALGLILILLAIRPGRASVVPLRSAQDDTVTVITHAGLRRQLSLAARTVHGVDTAKIKIGRRSLRVRAHTPLRDRRDMDAEVARAVESRLTELRPLDRRRLNVTIKTTK